MANVTPINGVQTTSKLTPAQRAANFNLQTRMYEQTLGSLLFKEGTTIQGTLPKSRFASKLYLMVSGTFKCTHAAKTTFSKSLFDKYNVLKQVRVNYNSGFNPYQISGSKLYLYNKLLQGKNKFLDGDVFGTDVLENNVSAGGTTNKIKFTLELPFNINDRDTIGLMNLQYPTASTTLEIDCDNLTKVMTDTDVTVSEVNLTITPVLRTFSIPALADAVPDYSVIKLVNEEQRPISGNGDVRFELQTGLTYRKLMLYITSDGVTPIDPSKVIRFQLAFQQADTPYTIPADYLAYKNKIQYQGSLPLGCYVFDFTDSGFVNYAGSRDYVDTENLTQLDLVITFAGLTGTDNRIYIVPEKLGKMS